MGYGVDFCTGGTATDSKHAGAYVAANAFDDNVATFWDCYIASPPEWIKYDLGVGVTKTASQYTITFHNWSYPKDWLFQGSNDDSAWTTIDSQAGQSFTAGQKKTYNSFSNSTAYRYYRWYFTSINGNDLALQEIEAMESSDINTITSSIVLSSILLMSGTIMKGNYGDITASLPIPITMTGTMQMPDIITAAIPITITMSGTMESFGYFSGEAVYLRFPPFTLSASGILSNFGVSNIEFPVFEIEAEGYSSNFGTASFNFPVFSLSATGDVEIVGTANISFPKFTLEATGHPNSSGTLDIDFPVFTLDAEALAGVIGTLDKKFPTFTLSATGVLSNYGSASILFPVFTLSTSALASAGYLAMVLNIKNRALTLYENYDFNSMCRFNDKHFGATKTAIYDLDSGTTDAGTLIDWNMKTGYLDLEQKIKKRLRQAWLSYKTDGDLILTITQPNGDEYEYQLEGIDTTETGLRVKFGKGIRSKYVALDIKNVDGSSIDLDVIKLHLEKLGVPR
jgi:hypothetical protein